MFDLWSILNNLVANAVWVPLTFFIAWVVYRWRRTIHPVRIQVRKVEGPELTRTRPRIIISTFTGYQRRLVPQLTEQEFKDALKSADLGRLPITAATQSIGQTARLVDTYRDSLQELFLISTVSKNGASSLDSVPLLRKYAETLNPKLVIHGEAEYAVSLDEDTQVAEGAHEVTRRIFAALKRDKRYKPDDSAILVDVSGGPRSMTIGVLLACLRPEQDLHLVGTRYDPAGNPDSAAAFPMVIHFEPELRFK